MWFGVLAHEPSRGARVGGCQYVGAGVPHGVWVDSADGNGWSQVGQFRQSVVDNIYDAGAARPSVVKITIERTGMTPDAPGLEVMTGRFAT